MIKLIPLLLLASSGTCNYHPNPIPPDSGTGGADAATGGASAAGGSVGVGGATAAGTSVCDQACANLASLRCPEAADLQDCVRICTVNTTSDLFTQDTACRINAKTVADAQKCGPASCR